MTLTTAEAAERVGVAVRTIRLWVERGYLLADAHTSLRERARYVTHWREVPQ